MRPTKKLIPLLVFLFVIAVPQYVENKNDHSSVMIIGNEATGLWKKAYALAPAASLIQIIEQVAADIGGVAVKRH